MGIILFVVVPLTVLAAGVYGLVLMGSALFAMEVRQRVYRGVGGLVLVACSAAYFAYAWQHVFVG
ncbi:MAG: hypothetical protein JWN40_1873 [Phycisphaerales bacterium]|nr:hypothetical protein [Phycisphaerales bacterium]